MAGVSRDRGQMLLIGAFVLAVMFVALALIVNSAIYTQSLSSRNHAGGAEDALQARHTVETGVGDAMERANVHNNTDMTTLENHVDAATETIGEIVGREYAANGRFVSVETPNHQEGTRIADNVSGGSTFVGASGVENWTVARNVETRAFVMDIRHGSVVTGSDTFGGDVTDEFYVTITDGTDRWRVNVTERSNAFEVGVEDGSGDSTTCTVPGSPDHVELDLTAGTVDGRDCPGLTFAEGVGTPYTVEFNESNEVEGNYSLVVDSPSHNPSGELVSGLGARTSHEPYWDTAVYASTFRYHYDSPAVAYETDVRVAPGEPE